MNPVEMVSRIKEMQRPLVMANQEVMEKVNGAERKFNELLSVESTNALMVTNRDISKINYYFGRAREEAAKKEAEKTEAEGPWSESGKRKSLYEHRNDAATQLEMLRSILSSTNTRSAFADSYSELSRDEMARSVIRVGIDMLVLEPKEKAGIAVLNADAAKLYESVMLIRNDYPYANREMSGMQSPDFKELKAGAIALIDRIRGEIGGGEADTEKVMAASKSRVDVDLKAILHRQPLEDPRD